MTNPQFLALVLAIALHTGAFVWWGASLTTTVKRNSRDISDHEIRLRQVEVHR